MLSITSVSVSRVMLSIQSFAAGLRVDPKWLLSHAELSRVQWRKGSHEGELIVEIECVEVPGHDFRVPPPVSNAVVLRNTPSRDRPYYTPLESPRDRTSPDRFPPELIRERRMSIAGSPTELPGYFDRPTLGRRSSVSSRGRSSPPEEFPRVHTSKPIPIRARTLSKSEILRGLREPNVAIAGVEPIAQARTVRFSENLICPSPIPRDRRRKGWFNKRWYFNFHNSGNLAN